MGFQIKGTIRQIQKIATLSPEIIKEQAKEMQHISKYLELAVRGTEDRFNAKEITELTQAMKNYVTESSKVDILKELLSIGANKGEMLSTEELKNFLALTSELNAQGQKRIISFIKHTKENILRPQKTSYTRADIEEIIPYEQFKKKKLEYMRQCETKPFTDEQAEETIRSLYDNTINSTLLMYQNPYERAVLENALIGINPMDYIKHGNADFIQGIATCNNPEKLAEIVKEIGVNMSTSYIPNELIKLMELSGNNKELLHLLSENFYPSEIKEIVTKLENSLTKSSVLKNFVSGQIGDYRKLNIRRKAIIQKLGLAKEITLAPIEQKSAPRITYLRGDCGRGKHSR